MRIREIYSEDGLGVVRRYRARWFWWLEDLQAVRVAIPAGRVRGRVVVVLPHPPVDAERWGDGPAWCRVFDFEEANMKQGNIVRSWCLLISSGQNAYCMVDIREMADGSIRYPAARDYGIAARDYEAMYEACKRGEREGCIRARRWKLDQVLEG